MSLFGGKGKKEDEPNIPTNTVLQMREQGLSNNQVIQNLQRSGFSSSQIFDAMNQADIKSNVQQAPTPDAEAMENPIGGPPPMEPESLPMEAAPQTQDYAEERIEELVEAIIDEKWAELVKNINKVIEWKNKVEAQISSMEQELKDVKDSFGELHKAMIGKISEYDKNIVGVSTELKAMGKVFEKVLPAFTENVDELSRITRNIKKK